MGLNSRYIISFSQIDDIDRDLMGKKTYQLHELISLGVEIPDGFVVMPSLFKEFLEKTGISRDLERIQVLNHPSIKDSMAKLFEPVNKKIINTVLPSNIATELHGYYRNLSGLFKEQSLNIFTSPLKGKSLQFLNIKGDTNMILTIKKIWTQQLINPTPIVVQKNIKAKIKGKIITNNPSIDEKFASLAKKIQKHFYFPQEFEYVIEKNKIYVTVINPFTGTLSQQTKPIAQTEKLQRILIRGIPLTPGIVTGSVRILRNQDYYQVKKDEIAVIPQLSKFLFSRISNAKAIVSDAELFTDHDKVLYRKNIKIPTIMGVKNAVNILHNKSIITVNGINGKIYSGGLI